MMRTRAQTGFTLVEMMIVVAIILVLSVVAGGAYRKYSNSARKSEVIAVFGEIKGKEEAYRAEFSQYLSSGTGETHRLTPRLVVDERDDRVGHRRVIARRHQKSREAVTHDFWNPAAIRWCPGAGGPWTIWKCRIPAMGSRSSPGDGSFRPSIPGWSG